MTLARPDAVAASTGVVERKPASHEGGACRGGRPDVIPLIRRCLCQAVKDFFGFAGTSLFASATVTRREQRAMKAAPPGRLLAPRREAYLREELTSSLEGQVRLVNGRDIAR